MFDEAVYARHVERKQAVQIHPVPDRVMDPKGPFPAHLFDEPEIVFNVEEEPLPGATAQNNFRPPKYLRCARCTTRVLEADAELHKCGE